MHKIRENIDMGKFGGWYKHLTKSLSCFLIPLYNGNRSGVQGSGFRGSGVPAEKRRDLRFATTRLRVCWKSAFIRSRA